MSLTDLCQICESTIATHTCDNCGTSACDEHFDRTRGLCARCVGSIGGTDDIGAPDIGGEDDVGGDPLR